MKKMIMLFSLLVAFSCEDKSSNDDKNEETGDLSWNYEWAGSVVVDNFNWFTLPGGYRTTPTTSEASIEITFSDVNDDMGGTKCSSNNYYLYFGELTNNDKRKMLFVDRGSPAKLTKGVDFFEGDTGPLWFACGCSWSGQPQPSVTINSVKLTSK